MSSMDVIWQLDKSKLKVKQNTKDLFFTNQFTVQRPVLYSFISIYNFYIHLLWCLSFIGYINNAGIKFLIYFTSHIMSRCVLLDILWSYLYRIMDNRNIQTFIICFLTYSCKNTKDNYLYIFTFVNCLHLMTLFPWNTGDNPVTLTPSY